jgi:hypothetical protein
MLTNRFFIVSTVLLWMESASIIHSSFIPKLEIEMQNSWGKLKIQR